MDTPHADELDLAILASIDSTTNAHTMLASYIRGEIDVPEGLEDEIREDMAVLVELLQNTHNTTLGQLSKVCRRYEGLTTRLCDLFDIDPKTLVPKGPDDGSA